MQENIHIGIYCSYIIALVIYYSSIVCDGYEKVVMKTAQKTSHSMQSVNHHYSFIQKIVVSMAIKDRNICIA